MKNLKKVLALVLAFACAFTMFAGAAFTDQADIESTDAVDTLVALGVIQGYTDGSFRPETTVTRAEMAKMIYTILNGGNDDASAYENLPTSFTDLTEDWYKGYVKYLQNSDIIAGTSATTFAPNETVTGVEAAKMMLVAAGYSPDKAGLTGLSWRVNTMKYANANSLFAGVNCDINRGLPRQYAAQILYNSLDMENVVYSKDIDGFKPATDVSEDKTIGGKYMDLVTYEGVLNASGSYSVVAGKSAGRDKLNVTVEKKNGTALTATTNPTKGAALTFDYATDLTDLLGQYVKVQIGKNDKVYGVFAMDSENTVVTAAFKDVKIDSGKIKVDGTSYNYNDVAITGVVKDNSDTALKISELKNTYAEVASGDQITFISNDGDDKFDLAIVNPMKSEGTSLDKVTYVSDSEFVAGGMTYDFDEVIAPSDLAKGDYVAYYENTFTGDKQFVKADVVTGKVTSTKGNPVTDVKIGDEWFKVGNSDNKYPFYEALVRAGEDLELNSTVTAQVINGVIYRAEVETATSTDTALVLAAPGSMDVDGNYQVKLLFADGSTKVVAADQAYQGWKNSLVTWEISDDAYELTKVSAANLAGGNTYTDTKSAGFVKADKKLDGKKVDSNATIYVSYKDGSKTAQKVMTGAELNALGGNFGEQVCYVVKDGLISLAYISDSDYLPGSNADQLYGYIVSDVTENNVDNVKYKQYDVYTTDGQLVEGVMQKATTEVGKGDFIKLNLTADNYAEGVDVLDEIDSNVSALMNYGDDYIVVVGSGNTSTTVDLDDDVKYLVVNTKDTKGISNEADLEKASETGNKDNEYYANVSYYAENGKAVLVVIDTTGKWYDNGDKTVTQKNATAPNTVQIAGGASKGMTPTMTTSYVGNITKYTDWKMTGFAAGTKDSFKFTVTDSSSTTAIVVSNSTIGGLADGVYASGTEITATSEGSATFTVTCTESGKATVEYTFTVAVEA